MNRLFIITVVLGLVAVSLTHGDGETKGVSKVTEKVMGGIKNAANKGAKGVASLADGVTVHVERYTNPTEHVPGQHNIVASAARGVGRLLRNATLEAGRFVDTVGRAAIRLGTALPSAAIGTARSAARRIAIPRGKGTDSKSAGETQADQAQTKATDAATDENASAPQELTKSD